MENKTHAIKECGKAMLAINDAMEILNGKWKISIIGCLCYKKMRYAELLREVKGISGRMLSKDLKELETHLLISRTVTSSQPVTVEYEITTYGVTLEKVIQEIVIWGLNHRGKIIGK